MSSLELHEDGRWGDAQESPWTEVHVPRGAACQQISEILGQVDEGMEMGEFSFSGEADKLPVLPGLTVKGFGGVSLPLRYEQAERIRQQFNLEQEAVWTLKPDQVEIKNSNWELGIGKLSAQSADRLGFKGIGLEPRLSKMMVIGAGAQLAWARDEDDTGVAKLVVQLPSEFTGGNALVIEEETQKLLRYELGEEAAFMPHYIVYCAGARYTVEKVESGYCLLMVYSLCMPNEQEATACTRRIDDIRRQLVQSIEKLSSQTNQVEVNGDEVDNSRFALLLTDRDQMERPGVGALSGVDRSRFLLLSDANSRLPPDKRLKFYLVCFRLASNAWTAKKTVSWYLMNGEELGDGNYFEWAKKLDVLNPTLQTTWELWECGYDRIAIVGWPARSDLANAYELMGEFAATAAILLDGAVETAKLRKLLDYIAEREERGKGAKVMNIVKHQSKFVSLKLCQNFCKAIIELDDMSLVNTMLKKYFSRLEKKEELIPCLAVLIWNFGWNTVGVPLLNAIDDQIMDNRMIFALKLANALKAGPAHTDLTLFAVKKARFWISVNPSYVANSKDLALLWKCGVECANPEAFGEVESVFKSMNEMLLGPVVVALSQFVTEANSLKHRTALTSIATRRRKWLRAQLAELEEPFTWKVTDNDFPDAIPIKTFLDSSKETLQIKGFVGISAARERAAFLKSKIEAPLGFNVFGRGSSGVVEIVKLRGVFGRRKTVVRDYRAELARLDRQIQSDGRDTDASSSSSPTKHTGKRLREELENCVDNNQNPA